MVPAELYILLATNPTILNLADKKLTDENIVAIAQYLKTSKNTKKLMLFANGLDNNGIRTINMKVLCEALKINQSLENLSIINNNLHPESARHLAEVLSINPSIKYLDLGGNQLGAEGAQYLAQALRNNKSLIELKLFMNNIGPIGARHLADALKENKTLQTLHVMKNSLGSEGMQYFNQALYINHTLKEFIFDNNNLSLKDIQNFTELLKTNTSITCIGRLGGFITGFSVDQTAVLFDRIKQNCCIEALTHGLSTFEEVKSYVLKKYPEQKRLLTGDLDRLFQTPFMIKIKEQLPIAELFVYMVLFTDGYLQLQVNLSKDNKTARFFNIVAQLSLDLQMILANRFFQKKKISSLKQPSISSYDKRQKNLNNQRPQTRHLLY